MMVKYCLIRAKWSEVSAFECLITYAVVQYHGVEELNKLKVVF